MNKILTIITIAALACGLVGFANNAPDSTPDSAEELYKKGKTLLYKHDYTNAETYLSQALQLYLQAGDKRSAGVVYSKLGDAYKFKGLNSKSAEFYLKSFEIGNEVADSATMLDASKDLVKVYTNLGNVTEANRFDEIYTELVEKSDNADQKIDFFVDRHTIALNQENYDVAEAWLRRIEPLIREASDSTFRRQSYLYFLGRVYEYRKDYDTAEKYLLQAVKIDPSTRLTYNNLISLYRYKGDKEKCYAAIDSLDKYTPKDGKYQEYSLYMMSAIHKRAFGDFAEALEDFKKSYDIYVKNYGPKTQEALYTLELMIRTEMDLERFDDCVDHYKQLTEYYKEIYGADHLYYAQKLIALANAEAFAGRLDNGAADFARAADILRAAVRRQMPYASVGSKHEFWDYSTRLLSNMPGFGLGAGQVQNEFTRSCFDATCLTKAFLLDSERSALDLIRQHGSKQDLDDFTEITKINTHIKDLSRNIKDNADSIAILNDRKTELEHDLTRRCKTYGDITDFFDIDYYKIRNALRPGEVLFDFSNAPGSNKSLLYTLFVVNSTQQYPLLKKAFTQQQLDSISATNPYDYYDAERSAKLLKLVWDPIKDYATEGSTVYYVPSAHMSNMQIESLTLPDGSLLSDHYNFVRLSSARQITRLNKTIDISSKTTAHLYGGIDYFSNTDSLRLVASRYAPLPQLASRGDLRGDSLFYNLPGTRTEVESIRQILARRGVDAKIFADANASEEAFFAIDGNAPAILHLATHGFYYQPQETSNYLKGYTDAMSLSGLALAGANTAWSGKDVPDDLRDGILTANDIAGLNLHGLRLTVLSACKSGQGEPSREGIFGLQRAFKKAGAETLLMTAWKVSDKVTADFMKEFYTNLADRRNRGDIHAAFHAARTAIRQQYPEPFYWAGFILLD